MKSGFKYLKSVNYLHRDLSKLMTFYKKEETQKSLPNTNKPMCTQQKSQTTQKHTKSTQETNVVSGKTAMSM